KIELNGEPHILTIINDITQRRLAEIKLKESEEKFSKAFNSNALAMCITTFEESLLIEANKAFLDVIDISREEYIGKRTTAFNSWSPVPKRRDLMLKQLKDEGIIVNVESEFVSFTGETKYGLFSFVKIELNEKSHILTIINDITPLKLAEQKLKESEVKFSKAFNSNALAMSITTFEEGIVIEANKAFLEILDFTTDDYIGKSIEELQGWSLQPKRRGLMLKQLKEEGIIVNAESEFVSFKGEPKYGLFSFVKIELNEEPHILTIINDITPLKLAEQKLKQSEKHYRLISEASRAVMWTSDLNINLTYVDPIVLNIFGATSEEVIALPLSSYLTPESLETTYRVMEEELRIEMSKTKDLNRSWTYETIQIHKNGTKIPVENILTFLRDDDEKAIGILGISRDISERKKTENQLKESEKKYREAYDMANFYKDLFTHDMNNILHIIGSSVEIIDLQLGESEKSVFIENMTKMIHSQVDRGAKLISDVRTLTELDDAEIPINRVNITEFLKKSINFIEKSYSEKNLSIFAKKLDRDYYTNGNDLLQDVFDNILRNGIKHNENSDIQISIKIFKQKIKGKKYIKLEFIDNGIGIPEDRKIDIFQPSNRERKGSKGMGIGLSLVKKILTIFKGKIWVEDKIEGDYTQGSKFIVLLPEVD
ncbi:MAG: PAS domain S-box protein, partial [Promethearchaeota archaeon]